MALRAAGDDLKALSEGCARGSRDAFDEAHRRFDRGLRALFARRGTRSEAELDELSQQTWLGLWRAFSTGRYDPERASISTYVYAVAMKTWLKQRSRGAFAGTADGGLESAIESVLGDPESEVQTAAEELEAIRACLKRRGDDGALTDDEHAIVVSAAAGASDRELAQRFGIAPSTINARKQAGWGKLRRMMARLGFREQFGERERGSEE